MKNVLFFFFFILFWWQVLPVGLLDAWVISLSGHEGPLPSALCIINSRRAREDFYLFTQHRSGGRSREGRGFPPPSSPAERPGGRNRSWQQLDGRDARPLSAVASRFSAGKTARKKSSKINKTPRGAAALPPSDARRKEPGEQPELPLPESSKKGKSVHRIRRG